ncbi:MAG: OsmC family protein [Jiangellaceae bacterium]
MTLGELNDSMARFRANPLAAQTAPAVTATLAGGQGRLTGGPFAWEVDLPPVVGGGNGAPSPTLYLLGALAGCAVAFIHDTLAPQLGVRLAGVTATARCRSDLRGLLGMDGGDPRLTGLSVEITVDSPDSPEQVEALRQAWLQRCPIYLALLNPVPVEVSWLDGNGAE